MAYALHSKHFHKEIKMGLCLRRSLLRRAEGPKYQLNPILDKTFLPGMALGLISITAFHVDSNEVAISNLRAVKRFFRTFGG